MTIAEAKIVVAIPVLNEADHIGPCLRALASQGAADFGILLLLNNCTDDTAAVVEATAPSLGVPVHVVEALLPTDRSHAGSARALAFECAAALLPGDGILLTTDADGEVHSGWLAANLRSLRSGAEVVFGRAEISAAEAAAIPEALREADAAECTYAALLDEILGMLDPDPTDPWPRHDEHSGASIAALLHAYRRAGGIPPLSLGEDRAFARALLRVDARVRHAPEVAVTVSARTTGRASGGMADTIRRRMTKLDDLLDDRLEPAADLLRRGALRRSFRGLWTRRNMADPPLTILGASLRLPGDIMTAAVASPYFGTAWDDIECSSPVLRRRRVPAIELDSEMAIAHRILASLHRRYRAVEPDASPELEAALAAE